MGGGAEGEQACNATAAASDGGVKHGPDVRGVVLINISAFLFLITFISERGRIVEAVKTTLTGGRLWLLPLQSVELFEKIPIVEGNCSSRHHNREHNEPLLTIKLLNRFHCPPDANASKLGDRLIQKKSCLY